MDDVRRLASILNQVVAKVNRQGDATLDELRLLHVAVNQTATTIGTLQEEIQLSEKQTQALIISTAHLRNLLRQTNLNIRTMSSALRNVTNYVTDTVDAKIDILTRLITQSLSVNNFLSGLNSLAEGNLSPHIVPPQTMSNALRTVKNAISKSHPGYTINHMDLIFYYTHHLSSYAYTDKHLLVHVQVPFSREESSFTLYKTHSFPIPLAAHDPRSQGMSQVTSISDYLAVSPDRSTYFELTQPDLSVCVGTKILICPYDQVMVHRPQYSCTAALFFRQDDAFTAACSPSVFPDIPVPDNVIPIGRSRYLITTNSPSYSLTCADQAIQSFPARAYAQVSVPCGCTLTINMLTVSPSLSSCDETLTLLKTLQPINYHLFMAFDFHPHHFPSYSLSNTSLALDVPDVNSYITNFTDLSDTMKKNGLNLKQVTEAIAQARSTYEKPNVQIDPDLTFLPFVNDSSFLAIFVTISSILLLLLVVATSVLSYKLYRTNVLLKAGYVAAATSLPSTKASLLTKSTPSLHPPIRRNQHWSSTITSITPP